MYQLEDCIEELSVSILNSELSTKYIQAKLAIETNTKTLNKKNEFLQLKRKFDQISEYGEHAPGYTELRRSVRKAKRSLDMDEEMAEFHFSETELQGALDKICQEIAKSISLDIKVDAGNPFFETGNKSCGGSCQCG